MIDLTILGAGAAGCRAAQLAAKAGFSVLLMDSGSPGGGAVHEGYWPYRRMLSDAAMLTRGREGFLGLRMLSEFHIYDAMIKRMQADVAAMEDSHKSTLSELGVELVNASGYVEGLKNNRYIVRADDRVIESRRLLVCTGSMPSLPDFTDLEKYMSEGLLVTPKELLYQKLPRKALVLGGTLRSLQMAAWMAANRVQTALLCDLPVIAPELDAEVSSWLVKSIRGIEFLTGVRVMSYTREHLTIAFPGGGRTMEYDRLAAGGKRYPATRGTGLRNAGIALENGAIITDLTCHTNLPDVYAAGDVNMRTQSAIGAFREAEVCVSNMLGRRASMSYRAVPRIFESYVSGASVGETAETAAAIGCNPICVTQNINSYENGFVKLIADEGGHLLGAHLCSREDIGVIWELASIIESGLDILSAAKYLCPRTETAAAAQEAMLKI